MNRFAIFIISHNRANIQLTYNSLKKSGYTGDLFIVIDDEDEQKETYYDNYADNLIIFSKDEMLKECDTVDNFNNKATALLPSNYCFKLAQKMGYEYFMKIDDDFTAFSLRIEQDNKLRGFKIDNMDLVIKCCLKYMDDAKLDLFGFENSGGLFGGLNGDYKNGLLRSVAGAFIFRTDTDMRFLGTRNEDANICYKYSNIGKKIFTIYKIVFNTCKRGTNSGGCQEDYNATNDYVVNFYSVIVAPHYCKIGFKKGKFGFIKNKDAYAPMILNARYKKC